MRHSLPHKFVTLLFLVVVIAASVVGLCRETHAAERCWSDHEQAACSLAAPADQCPSCPPTGHGADSDCDSSCYCNCHLPVTSRFSFPIHTPHISLLVPFDSFFHFPEVYLPKFIPPQNQA